MARVTVEDCIDKVDNRFELVLLASHRARLISQGAPITIDRDNDKNPVVALREIADEMLVNPDVDLITFTGGVAVGKYIAAKAVYKRQVLELGGNDPIIVMEDADIDEAATLAATGSYKNSGQRCTAVKRMLVHEDVADAFVEFARGRLSASYNSTSASMPSACASFRRRGNSAPGSTSAMRSTASAPAARASTS